LLATTQNSFQLLEPPQEIPIGKLQTKKNRNRKRSLAWKNCLSEVSRRKLQHQTANHHHYVALNLSRNVEQCNFTTKHIV
jgi:hypothetical protein